MSNETVTTPEPNLEPGTPEYQEAYDKAMEELDNPTPKTEEKPEEEETPETDVEPETPDTSAVDPLQEYKAEMEKRYASTEKALKDTQKWGHSLATTVKELKKQLETATAAQRPALLDQVEGLQDAIDYAVKSQQTPKEEDFSPPSFEPPKNNWVDTVSAALPDMDAMLNDPELNAKALELQKNHASEWEDPVKAIRYLSNLRTEYLTQKAVREALAATSAKQIETQQRKDGMRVPSGGAKAAGRVQVDLINDADAVNNMTPEQFQKLRARTLGY
jgi:hypothetical protein